MSNNSQPNNGVPAKPANYRRLTDDDLFRHSSQYRFWSFTPDQLKQKRVEINAQAVASVEESLRRFITEHRESLGDEEMRTIEEKAVPVNMEEEVKLVNFYAKKVQAIAQRLNLPTEIVATAITFFRRFFLENSVLEIEPKTIVFTTIFLACKSENYFIGIDSFAAKTKGSKTEILKYEFKILESLKFCLMNHHPYKALHGFFLDIQVVLHGKVDLKYMGQIYDRCKRRITNALLTDVVYYYAPPQITLAVLMLEDEALTTRYLELKFHGNTESEKPNQDTGVSINFDKLISMINSCKDVIENATSVPVEEAKAIMAKVLYSRNPQVLLNKLKRKNSSESPEDSPDKRLKT
ncbi:hypothetical protein ZYGR_0AS05670 [Zygosaccharomyces rouxii]|uniref:Cyclin-like domain-containing protein n=1 Tax=Zygosaccharomyces rouxii TaxID=4956 RepID=A0A1Q3AIC1_ZYGRO|nr:hypothetical protein ZYGR_0AS05670 [Zygosaccharomyces rouxii]